MFLNAANSSSRRYFIQSLLCQAAQTRSRVNGTIALIQAGGSCSKELIVYM